MTKGVCQLIDLISSPNVCLLMLLLVTALLTVVHHITSPIMLIHVIVTGSLCWDPLKLSFNNVQINLQYLN